MKIDAIKKELSKGVKTAVKEVKEEVLAIIKGSIDDFYAGHDPHEYIRTMQLINTIVDNGIKTRNIGAGFEIYFDSGMMAHASKVRGKSGRWHKAEWSESKILEVTFEDPLPHGHYTGADSNEPIWDILMYDLRDINIIIYAALIEAGVPVH